MRWRTIQLYWNKLFSSSCKKFNFSSITISLWTQWLRGTCYYRKFKKATNLPVINANAIFRKCNISVISSPSRYSSCFVDCLCLTSSFPLPSSWKYLITSTIQAWLYEWLKNLTYKLQILPSSWKYVLNWQWNSDFVNSKEIAMLKDLNRAFCLCQTFLHSFEIFWQTRHCHFRTFSECSPFSTVVFLMAGQWDWKIVNLRNDETDLKDVMKCFYEEKN